MKSNSMKTIRYRKVIFLNGYKTTNKKMLVVTFFENFRIKSLGIESDYRNHSLSATWSDTKHYNIFDNSDLIILTASH